MALTLLISPLKRNRIAYFPPLFFSHKLSPSIELHRNAFSYCHSLPPFSYQSLAPSCLYSLSRRAITPIACDANNSASGEEDDNQALEMFTLINNKNSQEPFEIFGVESPCVCNLVSFFQASQQVLDFLSHLRSIVGKKFKIVVKPSLDDGMDVGIKWRFEWKTIHAPPGKGFSFHISQTYQGKAMIRNIEMFTKPLLPLEPFRLRAIAYYAALMARMGSLMSPEFEDNGKRILCIVLPFLSLAVSLCLRFTPDKSMS